LTAVSQYRPGATVGSNTPSTGDAAPQAHAATQIPNAGAANPTITTVDHLASATQVSVPLNAAPLQSVSPHPPIAPTAVAAMLSTTMSQPRPSSVSQTPLPVTATSASSSPPLAASASSSTVGSSGLHDAFDGTGNITWTNLPANGTVANGVLTMATTNQYPVVESLTPIALQGQSASVRLVSTPNTSATSTQAFFQLYQPGTPNNYLGWMWTANNTLSAEVSTAGKVTTLGTATYSPSTQWLRISENAGTLSWQTSADGANWTSRATTSDTTVSFPIGTMTYKLGTGYWRPETNPGTTVWDDASVTPNPASSSSVGSSGLHDAFDGTGNIAWTNLPVNGTVANGVLTMATTNQYPVVESLTPIALQGQSASVRLVSTPNTSATSTQAFFQLYQPGTPNNYLGWMWTANNTLSAEVSTAGKVTTLGTATYSPNTQWLRISENAGTLSWQTSADGVNWTSHATTSDTNVSFPIGTMTYKLGTGYWRPETNPGTTVWDDAGATGNYFATTAVAHSLDVGVFVPQDGSGGTVNDFASLSGAQVKNVLQFYSLPDAVPVGNLNAINAAGRTPVIALEPWDPAGGPNQPQWSLSTIIAGTHDGDFQRWATTLKTLPYQVILRPMHEMNGSWYPWAASVNGNTADQYVAAWQHIHNLFNSAGVTNVKWMWAPNTPYAGSTPITRLFPGARYVDILGIDGYNWGNNWVDRAWVDPAALFSEGIRELQSLNTGLPIMISEMGSAEDGVDPTRKAEWITRFFDYAEHVPGLTGFIWFDMNKERDWRIDSSSAALTAFDNGIASLPSSAASNPA
jgi:Glycosyl hydrolase family 26